MDYCNSRIIYLFLNNVITCKIPPNKVGENALPTSDLPTSFFAKLENNKN
jgi:hypothetical protein